ncbi:hypothetical protein [Pseudoalteromonas sp. OOF1S-7]|uniref:hypothetical protein n=1 Tax=Pseudoalteromonas sp. OOF1S-7 TaxID=2917757 RepID=UPI001EF3DC61|nr:hypothetical protein [Pseudoalteromonas sp. OOF1S-7]MCG7536545.1 hypothetical protein [Pseudoalteromonas sp. OOF1S-7]
MPINKLLYSLLIPLILSLMACTSHPSAIVEWPGGIKSLSEGSASFSGEVGQRTFQATISALWHEGAHWYVIYACSAYQQNTDTERLSVGEITSESAPIGTPITLDCGLGVTLTVRP